jgi:hypothetical protein
MFSKHTFGPRTYSTGLAQSGGQSRKRQQRSWGRPPTKQRRDLQREIQRQAEVARDARAVAERSATTRSGGGDQSAARNGRVSAHPLSYFAGG